MPQASRNRFAQLCQTAQSCWSAAARSRAKSNSSSTLGPASQRTTRICAWCSHPAIPSASPRLRHCSIKAESVGFGARNGRRPTSADFEAGSILLLDSIGELAALYSLAAVAFVGGSLVPAGGHNPLEPAQFGVPILMGPHYENFREIVEKLKARQAIRIVEPAELSVVLLTMLREESTSRTMGDRAREVFHAEAGATARTVDALLALLAGEAPREPHVFSAALCDLRRSSRRKKPRLRKSMAHGKAALAGRQHRQPLRRRLRKNPAHHPPRRVAHRRGDRRRRPLARLRSHLQRDRTRRLHPATPSASATSRCSSHAAPECRSSSEPAATKPGCWPKMDPAAPDGPSDPPKTHVHLLDDGFQHRQLARDVDIVVVHRSDFAERLLPAGRLREPLSALRRADFLALREEDADLEPRLHQLKVTAPILWMRRSLTIPNELAGTAGKVIAFCGIARPDEFFSALIATRHQRRAGPHLRRPSPLFARRHQSSEDGRGGSPCRRFRHHRERRGQARPRDASGPRIRRTRSRRAA